jgi:hypothetical protein
MDSYMDSYMDSSSIDRFLLAGDDDGNREEDDHYVYNEHFGELAPRITGSISVISSALIIYVILRSPNGLSTIYHRIMFGMSFVDILGSAAIAFTHLAMPRPGISEIIDNYGFEGTRLGNTDGYNNSLCVYYACIIAFSMHEARVTRKVEPFLHFLPIGSSIGMASIALFYEMYNPTPGSAWCTIREYLCMIFKARVTIVFKKFLNLPCFQQI